MWNNKSISVVLPTYRESQSIRGVIEDFKRLRIIDEIIVINNNAEIGTSDAISGSGAVEVFEKEQGYGAAIKTGLRYCHSDLIVICEPDGTFQASDLLKLLPFMDRAALVLGSRTVGHYIWSEANMGHFLKWGNWFVAKLIEVLFGTGYLSDVGCTFRVTTKEVVQYFDFSKFHSDGTFGMEFQLVAAMAKLPITQVPVNYYPRVGVSGYTGNLKGAFTLGIRMIGIIIEYRLVKKRKLRQVTNAARI